MSHMDQVRADAANDAYVNRSQRDVETSKAVSLDGKDYTVFGYANDPTTGFHATAYQNVAAPHDVIIAYRGTDPALFSGATSAERRDHALTTLQDIAVDAKMVRDNVNPQKAAADAFTADMLAKAASRGIPSDQISVAGHSLGGALAELEAAKYGLRGATFNGYGAAQLTDGPAQPGCQLTNYRMAGDVVSAASPHIGEVVSLASQDDIQSLRAGRYLDAPAGAPPPNVLIAMRLDDHGGQQHFGSQSPENMLQPARFAEAVQRSEEHEAAIAAFRSDVSQHRGELSLALRQMQAGDGQRLLPPGVQRQVNEYLTLHADQPIRDRIEGSGIVQGVQHGLQSSADAVRSSGRYVQALDERIAAVAREGGRFTAPFIPVAPLAGHVVGEAARLHGRGADAAARWVGGGLESAKSAVERGAHAAADAVVERIHDPRFQAGVANVANHIVNAYDGARVAAQAATQTYQLGKQAVSDGVERAERAVTHTYAATRHAISQAADSAARVGTQAYETARQTATQGIDAAKHAAGQAYDTLTHPGQWFQRGTPAPASAQPHPQTPAATHPHGASTPPASSVQAAPSAAHATDRAQNLNALSASDQAMFARIRKDVPAHIDDAHVAQAMLGAKQAGIVGADKIDRVQMAGDTLWVSGTTPGFRAATDVAQAAAPMHETVQRAQAFNQQREQHVAMEAQQRQQDAHGRSASVLG
ncbi:MULTISPECIES: hypothetical protein [Xanthomonas]|uniref:hypothetical protein n=1 Tax=Xanthomonas TaxID=338 RepID=UPI0002E79A23|nr:MULTISPECIES: hypothetical protein [Xanthomonas]MCI2244769.1 hypothetical protein [Xanthomonas indica]UYC11336.1 hypothetical protein NUG21_16465 [Xanthomonas sp. CFBP 8445]